jgi:hypothetical protein
MLRAANTSRFAKAWVIAAIVLMAHWVVPGALILELEASPSRSSDNPGFYAAKRVAPSTLPRLVAISANLERNPQKLDAAAWPSKQPPAANSSSFEMRCPAATPIEPGAAVLGPAARTARAFEARGPPA